MSNESTSCNTSLDFILLIPFRDAGDGVRRAQLAQMKSHLEKIVPPSGHICIVEQSCDDQPFNRGQLLNIGFAACVARGQQPHWTRPSVVVLHDVNIAPDEATLQSYAGTNAEEPVRVFTAALQRFGKAGCFGGVVAICPHAFELANGFPNTFWGHSGEDSALQSRLQKKEIGWSQHFGAFERLDALPVAARVHGESAASMKTLRGRLATDKRRWRDDGLSSVEYVIETESVLEREGLVWGVHLIVKLGAVGVRCGNCLKWQPESCYSNRQANQRGPAENTVCKSCLSEQYSAVETNITRNEDVTRRSCTECGKVFSSRSQLFSHFPTCGEVTTPSECIPCKPALRPRPVSPRRTAHILEFVERIRRVAGQLPIRDARPSTNDAEPIIRKLIASQKLTFQSKATNVVQLQSLLMCIEALVTNSSSIILELGAGKALLTRALYEKLQRRVPVVALDNRPVSREDPFYDPLDVKGDDAPYTRIVANVQDTEWSQRAELQGPIVALTKHLCAGATDASLIRVCHDVQLQSVCMAPCCHQKMDFKDYCNLPYLESVGFGTEEDFKNLLFLIQVSKHSELKEHEYRKRSIIELLPFEEIREIGCLARRIIEEGRASYLRDRGFDVEVCRYVSHDVAPDNLAIIGRKAKLGSSDSSGYPAEKQN